MCCSAVNDGSCSPWVMCSSSVVRGNQIRDIVVFMCAFKYNNYNRISDYLHYGLKYL